MTQITIDNQVYEIPPGWTILEACREHGIPIPTLCYHPALAPYGSCRLCMVELDMPPRPPRLVAACVYPCEPGLNIQTASPAVLHNRRMMGELLLAGAWNSPEIVALAESLGVAQVRYHLPEADLCVLCGLCVRACQEIVGVNAISFIQRGLGKSVSPPFRVASGTCIACGTCTLICPTGAIHLVTVSGQGAAPAVHGPLPENESHYCQVCSEQDFRAQAFQPDGVGLTATQQDVHPGGRP
ncbi:MAG: 2Fe-2S iron-sulfur cluster-binding protein [Anaerolineales bacterium]|jgi:predicted molibdopterin-dependent oxidoreductase YjgC|nr:2Fe-2S iron-sulfur cluster-binding protein [Anaerolineales bacterium]